VDDGCEPEYHRGKLSGRARLSSLRRTCGRLVLIKHMIIRHLNHVPTIDGSAYVAPNAVVSGDVTIGKNVRVMHGAQIIAENSPVVVGDNCIILENAVIRGTENFPVTIGSNCLIGPNAHLAGCTVEDAVFIATGAAVFHGALLKTGSEVRVNGVVHLKTVLPQGATVPIGWVAVGNPAEILPPERHCEIWKLQKPLNFPLTVYGVGRPESGESNNMAGICRVMSERLGGCRGDDIVSE
jgi:carbonic anhydrase/acetyltransferase-like protein (isoleucine patch superfamily)